MSSNKDPREQEEQVAGEGTPQSETPDGAAAAQAAPAEEEKSGKKDKKEKKDSKKQPDCDELLKAERDKYLRLLAEYDNYRKRSAKERESIYQDVRADTVTKFLPVYDNLARALEQATCDEAYRKGVEMIMAQLRDILSRMGVTEIESLGQKFDPALHNAVMHEEDETKGEGEIVQELQRGFKMGDKVIRFAMVKVAN